jgi:hypothetical protein
MSDYKVEETLFGTKTSHPSYGTLAFSRRSGGSMVLFGTSIEHKDVIGMRLYHANITRGLHEDRIYGNKLIAEVEMSYSQFAELISSMNQGDGIPVTLKEVMGERKESCPFENKRMEFVNEFTEKVKEVQVVCDNLINDTKKLFDTKKPLNKTEKEQILGALEKIKREVNANIPFIADSFNEQMDKTVMEAKGEVEAFMQNKITNIVNNAIAENPDVLLGKMSDIKLLNEEE